MAKPNYHPCPECGGWKISSCPCCDCEQDCEHCAGTGLDPEHIDVDAYQAACSAMHKSGGGSSWSKLDAKGVTVGRCNERGDIVFIKNFARTRNRI